MITSPHNDKLKEIRRLNRRREARFVAEGEDLVEAAQQAGWQAVYRLRGGGGAAAGGGGGGRGGGPAGRVPRPRPAPPRPRVPRPAGGAPRRPALRRPL